MICFHCGEELDSIDQVLGQSGETYCSTACASECTVSCGQGKETPYDWQIMEVCALGETFGGQKYQR